MSASEPHLDRPLGLAAGVALVTGGVIGIGIYVLIAQISARAGTAQWLAFSIAILLSAIGVLPLVQVASALPLAGGGYLFTSRLLNPALGTVTSYWAVLGGSSSTALVSWGMADYLSAHLPFAAPRLLLALLIPGSFFALYWFGLRLALGVQVLLAAQLVIALLVYVVSGLSHPSVELSFALDFPRGGGDFILACVLCYSVCVGFQVIGEMGEEMQRPSRNIPLSLLIGGGIVLLVYLAVGAVFIGAVPYDFDAIRAMTAPLNQTGEQFLSGFWLVFLSIGALSAGLTSFNAGAIALPRELYSQARDGIVPTWLGQVDPRTRSPLRAVAAYFVFTFALILVGGLLPAANVLDVYGVMTAVGILLMTAVIAIAAGRLPRRYPERYQAAFFRLPPAVLAAASVVSVVSCVGFAALVLLELPWVLVVYVVWTLVVLGYYRLRVAALERKEPGWAARVAKLPGIEDAG